MDDVGEPDGEVHADIFKPSGSIEELGLPALGLYGLISGSLKVPPLGFKERYAAFVGCMSSSACSGIAGNAGQCVAGNAAGAEVSKRRSASPLEVLGSPLMSSSPEMESALIG
jgi:hypothetical protein